MLHRPSTESGRRVSHEVQETNVPRISISDPETPSSPHSTEDIPSPPILVVHPPSSIVDGQIESHGSASSSDIADSNLDQTALRIVYSPTVSRSGSISHSHAEQPSITITPNDDPDYETGISKETTAVGTTLTRLRASSINIQPHSPSHSGTLRSRSGSNRSSSHSQTCTSTPLENHQSANQRRSLSFEERGVMVQEVVFKAFPDKKWWKSLVVAKIALGVVTAAVLGNLAYTIVDTARGNSPLT